MSQRLDYYTTSPDLSKKLFELSQAVKKSSLGDTLLDLVNIRASQLNKRNARWRNCDSLRRRTGRVFRS